ncbi:type II toxin-antitoxin system HicB family antitoxin [Aeromonas caviae]|uniref:type II toxin-antitoxin system HicB family antitoxin n=1 Tax=Aeromonas caviae TaxID=648 RepID=UPI001BD4616D|nr:type II toxin-antitoxin system HicB family antitoxin [Aeromonas caviae]MBS4721178.1 type II toxin-antitoxin system HicB family antitoxin [Aeromonas caviae]
MSNNKLMKYKGFYGSIEFSLEDRVLFGKIECIADLITYEANTIDELNAAFNEAVDDYIETCAEIGKVPNKTLSGTLNIRIGPELHKKSYLLATNNGQSINDFIKNAVEEKIISENEKQQDKLLFVSSRTFQERVLQFTSSSHNIYSAISEQNVSYCVKNHRTEQEAANHFKATLVPATIVHSNEFKSRKSGLIWRKH